MTAEKRSAYSAGSEVVGMPERGDRDESLKELINGKQAKLAPELGLVVPANVSLRVGRVVLRFGLDHFLVHWTGDIQVDLVIVVKAPAGQATFFVVAVGRYGVARFFALDAVAEREDER